MTTDNIEIPKVSRDTAEALTDLDKNIPDPCKCLEQYCTPTASPSPYALRYYYQTVAPKIQPTIATVEKNMEKGSFLNRLGSCNFPQNIDRRIRSIIDSLTQPGPTFGEKNGRVTVEERNPLATNLCLVHLIPGLFNPEYPIVTVNARKIQGDIDFLQGLLALYPQDPQQSFLRQLIAQLEYYGKNVDKNQMNVFASKKDRPVEQAFRQMGRATAFVLLAAGTLVTGILSIFGRESPTAAALYGALAFLVANPEILGPTEERDANRALQAIGAAGLKGCPSKAYAHIVDRLFNDKAIREKVRKYLSERDRTAEYRKAQRQELFTMLKTDAESERILKRLLTDDKALDNLVKGLRNANTKGAQEHVLNYLDPLRMRGDDKLYARAR